MQAQDKPKTGNAPRWLSDLKSVYPESDYLAVIGEGDTRRDAESDAAGALSRIFEAKIKVESTAIMRYRELEAGANTKSSTEKSIDKTVQIGSEQALFNIQYSDAYTDKNGRVYVVGYLHRKNTARIYREKIDKNSEKIEVFLENMKDSESIIQRYAYIDAAVLYAKNNELLLGQLMIIHEPSVKMVDLPYNFDELNKLYASTAASMTFSLNIKNDSENRIAKMTAYILSTKGFTVSKGKAALSISGEVSIEDTEMNNKYQNIRYELILEMRDEKGKVIVSFRKAQRESAISRSEAIALAYRSMEKQINNEFIGQFEKYITSIILR